jgi:hypothetical protein
MPHDEKSCSTSEPASLTNAPPSVIDTLDNIKKQQLLRLLIEDVRVTGWHVQIRLRIALDPPPPEPPRACCSRNTDRRP